MYKKFLKPTLDRLVACALLVILSPLLACGFIAAAIDTRGNPMFCHTRPGLNEKPFRLLKLRTMGSEYDRHGKRRTNIERISRVGQLLRRTSIDELPQLFNVMSGSLSMVGPRPLEMRYLPHYAEEHRKRHSVKPGITGLAQVNGRNTLSWTEKFDLDVQYVNSISFWLDLNILLQTCKTVFRSKDINSSSTATMEPFVKIDEREPRQQDESTE